MRTDLLVTHDRLLHLKASSTPPPRKHSWTTRKSLPQRRAAKARGQVLQGRIMTFVNQIAEIIHGVVDEFHGVSLARSVFLAGSRVAMSGTHAASCTEMTPERV